MAREEADFDSKVMDIIRSQGSVYAVYPMNREVCGKVEADEVMAAYDGSIIDNEAVRRIISMKRRYCVFSKGFLQPSTERPVVWMDESSEICGHTVPNGLSFMVPDDAAWVTDTFVIYPDKIAKGSMSTMCLSYPMVFLEDRGIEGAIAYNPRLTTNSFLRSRLGFDGPEDAMLTIVALD